MTVTFPASMPRTLTTTRQKTHPRPSLAGSGMPPTAAAPANAPAAASASQHPLPAAPSNPAPRHNHNNSISRIVNHPSTFSAPQPLRSLKLPSPSSGSTANGGGIYARARPTAAATTAAASAAPGEAAVTEASSPHLKPLYLHCLYFIKNTNPPPQFIVCLLTNLQSDILTTYSTKLIALFLFLSYIPI